ADDGRLCGDCADRVVEPRHAQCDVAAEVYTDGRGVVPKRDGRYKDMWIGLTPRGTAHQNLCVALIIARSLRKDKSPTARMLQDKFGMSRATAYRWVRAWRDIECIP